MIRLHRYAEGTAVPVARSRGEIDRLLRDWKAEAISWTDEFAQDRATLRFVWAKDGQRYLARIALALPTAKELRSSTRTDLQFQKAMAARGKTEHRILLLWIKAALNAVELGIVSAEAIFLPFFEDAHGRTVAEVAVPNLARLLTGGAARLLGTGEG